MPSVLERRLIDFFIRGYNSIHTDKIIGRIADRQQEIPDAVCRLSDGRKIALELTSVFPPKKANIRHTSRSYEDFEQMYRTLNKKFLNNYRGKGIDEVWLVVHIRRTFSKDTVTKATDHIKVPTRYDKVFLHWPVFMGLNSKIGVLELPDKKFWTPK